VTSYFFLSHPYEPSCTARATAPGQAAGEPATLLAQRHAETIAGDLGAREPRRSQWKTQRGCTMRKRSRWTPGRSSKTWNSVTLIWQALGRGHAINDASARRMGGKLSPSHTVQRQPLWRRPLKVHLLLVAEPLDSRDGS
jgi:hypothetical protein